LTPRHIAHVFPYDPRHLNQTLEGWAASQLQRWPLAAVAASRLAGRSSVHVIGQRNSTLAHHPLRIESHRAVLSGPTWRDWGDDWSRGLEGTLARLQPDDVAVIHLNSYEAARLAQRSAARTRTVIVFHGRGVGPYDTYLSNASELVVLRTDAAEELRAAGAPAERVHLLQPSVDKRLFSPPTKRRQGHVLGFVGRLEPGKGAFELPGVLARVREQGAGARIELVGPAPPRAAAELTAASVQLGVAEHLAFLGEAPPPVVADLMRRWRLLLLPSYSEGFAIVVVEAAACGLATAAVTGVLPPELERQAVVSAAPRDEYADLVAGLLSAPPVEEPPKWPMDHAEAATAWDDLLSELPPFRAPRPVAVPRLRRLRRARRAVRNAHRHLRRRQPA
jgi:glycosyltransferase involved in cell wall biosynthesis